MIDHTSDKNVFLIDVGYACGGIVIDDLEIVIDTAPIFKWMLGKHFSEIKKWVERKDGKNH
jgi:hypothetical protein